MRIKKERKKTGVAITILERGIQSKENYQGYYKMIMDQEDSSVINIYAPYNRALNT